MKEARSSLTPLRSHVFIFSISGEVSLPEFNFKEYLNMILHLLIFSVILIIFTSPLSSSANANCTRVCGSGGRETRVDYPFGFTSGCEIPLNCSVDGNIQVGGYSVQNLTRDHILINFPAKCDRQFEEIRFFSGSNFALTSRNGLLLENCNSLLNNCVVSATIVENSFNLQQCNSSMNRSMNCYSEDNADQEEIMNLKRLETAGCKVLFSSVTADLNGTNSESSPVSLEFQSLQLGWWVQGDCKCHRNAVCRNVLFENMTIGYRCHCNEGYDGDGFVDGDGCHRGGSKNGGSLIIILPVIGAILVAVGIVFAIFFCRSKRKRRAIKEASPNQTETKAILTIDSSKTLTTDTQSNFTSSIPSYPSSKSSKDFAKSSYFGAQVFSYEELEVATDNFNGSRELGDGGFGTVYYGKLLDGREVAVKRLYENNFKRVEQFMNEVAILMGLDHENLVKLYGCTSKRSKELLLVYEYIPNGTIADHLHGKLANSNSCLFSWSVRLNIALETAEALTYLHKKDIIHRDVKTNNILLDKSFRVKVADFGLSRLFPNDATHVSTAPQGTPGYVDPEYYQCYQLTDKSDVYSFGVVLFELISSLRAVDTDRHRLDINLATMAMTKIQNHLLDELVDKSIGFESNMLVRRMVTLVAELGFRCVQQEKDMRPTMKEVVETLRGIQNDEMNAQKPEVLDIVVDHGGEIGWSPESRVTNKLVDGSVPNSSHG